jgi:hypothetical protein
MADFKVRLAGNSNQVRFIIAVFKVRFKKFKKGALVAILKDGGGRELGLQGPAFKS